MLALFLFFAAPVSARPVCSPELFGGCKTFARLPLNLSGSKELGLPVTPGATTIYNSLAGVMSRKNPPPPQETPEQTARAETLARQAIAAAKATIAGSTDPAYHTAEQRALLARLDAVRVKVLKNTDPDCAVSKRFVRGMPEANYAEEKHQLSICPSAAGLAPASLLLILTHELGHVVSPCAMAKNLYRVRPERLVGCRLREDEKALAGESFGGNETSVFPAGPALTPGEAALVGKLEKCRALENQPAAGLRGPGELYARLGACLDSRYAAAWKKYLRKNGSDAYDRAPGGDASLRCLGIYDEHFADAFGARVFGKILESAPDAAEMARVAMIEPATSVCVAEGEPPNADYPPDRERFLLHLAAPATQKALGCVLPPGGPCGLSDFFTYPRVPPATAGEEPSPGAHTSAE